MAGQGQPISAFTCSSAAPLLVGDHNYVYAGGGSVGVFISLKHSSRCRKLWGCSDTGLWAESLSRCSRHNTGMVNISLRIASGLNYLLGTGFE